MRSFAVEYTGGAMRVVAQCPKCGTRQDPEHPVCVHLMGAKGGRKAQRTLLERYGTEKHAEAGRKGGLARWGIKRDEG